MTESRRIVSVRIDILLLVFLISEWNPVSLISTPHLILCSLLPSNIAHAPTLVRHRGYIAPGSTALQTVHCVVSGIGKQRGRSRSAIAALSAELARHRLADFGPGRQRRPPRCRA